MPTTLTVEVTFELLTDLYPFETSWSLIDNSQDGAVVVHLGGQVDGGIYYADRLYSSTWTLNRCTFYSLMNSDYYGDGFSGSRYFEVKKESRKSTETI